MNKTTICFDLDGVICEQTKGDYQNASCKRHVVSAINDLYDNGFRIIIYTSRYMGRSDEDIIKSYKAGYNFTLNQLNDWNLKFHELFLGKPRYDILVDDKSIFYNDDWMKEFPINSNDQVS